MLGCAPQPAKTVHRSEQRTIAKERWSAVKAAELIDRVINNQWRVDELGVLIANIVHAPPIGNTRRFCAEQRIYIRCGLRHRYRCK